MNKNLKIFFLFTGINVNSKIQNIKYIQKPSREDKILTYSVVGAVAATGLILFFNNKNTKEPNPIPDPQLQKSFITLLNEEKDLEEKIHNISNNKEQSYIISNEKEKYIAHLKELYWQFESDKAKQDLNGFIKKIPSLNSTTISVINVAGKYKEYTEYLQQLCKVYIELCSINLDIVNLTECDIDQLDRIRKYYQYSLRSLQNTTIKNIVVKIKDIFDTFNSNFNDKNHIQNLLEKQKKDILKNTDITDQKVKKMLNRLCDTCIESIKKT